MRRPWVALAATLALSGCGGDGGGKGRAVTVPARHPLRIAADEYSFDPSTITVERAGEVTVVLRNKGRLAHDLRIRRGARDVGGTPAFEGGERTTRVRLEPGRYHFLCTVGDHEQLGMKGTVRVR
jgi:plastocyanin